MKKIVLLLIAVLLLFGGFLDYGGFDAHHRHNRRWYHDGCCYNSSHFEVCAHSLVQK